MTRDAPIRLPPSRPDLSIARAIARRTTPPLEQALKLVSLLADEKLILAGAAALWGASRCGRDRRLRHAADQIAAAAVVSSALPHLFKLLVARKRPDRTVVHGPRRRGVPRSGNAWDSFPSGHAMHLGALAAAGSRLLAPPGRHAVWPAAVMLAGTRILLLAHYPSDVAAGLAIGVAIDSAVRRVIPVTPG